MLAPMGSRGGSFAGNECFRRDREHEPSGLGGGSDGVCGALGGPTLRVAGGLRRRVATLGDAASLGGWSGSPTESPVVLSLSDIGTGDSRRALLVAIVGGLLIRVRPRLRCHSGSRTDAFLSLILSVSGWTPTVGGNPSGAPLTVAQGVARHLAEWRWTGWTYPVRRSG